ncbi:hypothetical protein SESBI_27155 [Sesbania bispinosa]|nr:hypothetical protein SESBI_27155 [Sesbania bispinosa]
MTHPQKELQLETLKKKRKLTHSEASPRLDLTPYVQKQQLGDFFEKNIKVYPTLPREFYVAASVERYGRRTPRIRNWLKRKEMILDIDLVCKLTGLKDEGIYLYNEKDLMDIAEV